MNVSSKIQSLQIHVQSDRRYGSPRIRFGGCPLGMTFFILIWRLSICLFNLTVALETGKETNPKFNGSQVVLEKKLCLIITMVGSDNPIHQITKPISPQLI